VCIFFLDEGFDLVEEVDGIKPEVLSAFCLIGTRLPVVDSDRGSFSLRGRPGFRLSDSDSDPDIDMFCLEGTLLLVVDSDSELFFSRGRPGARLSGSDPDIIITSLVNEGVKLVFLGRPRFRMGMELLDEGETSLLGRPRLLLVTSITGEASMPWICLGLPVVISGSAALVEPGDRPRLLTFDRVVIEDVFRGRPGFLLAGSPALLESLDDPRDFSR